MTSSGDKEKHSNTFTMQKWFVFKTFVILLKYNLDPDWLICDHMHDLSYQCAVS